MKKLSVNRAFLKEICHMLCIYTILTVWLFCTEKYKPEVDNADRACEVCILTERGLVFRGQNYKQLVLYLLTGRYIYKTLQF